MRYQKLLAEAASEFALANTSRQPPRRHARRIKKLLGEAWQLNPGKIPHKPVSVPADVLYVLLHQALQTIPG